MTICLFVYETNHVIYIYIDVKLNFMNERNTTPRPAESGTDSQTHRLTGGKL